MGRGRAKAKQTKVARELKYRPVGTDLNALRAELTGNGNGSRASSAPAEPDSTDEVEDDPYAAYAADDDESEDEEAPDRWGTWR